MASGFLQLGHVRWVSIFVLLPISEEIGRGGYRKQSTLPLRALDGAAARTPKPIANIRTSQGIFMQPEADNEQLTNNDRNISPGVQLRSNPSKGIDFLRRDILDKGVELDPSWSRCSQSRITIPNMKYLLPVCRRVVGRDGYMRLNDAPPSHNHKSCCSYCAVHWLRCLYSTASSCWEIPS